MKKIHLLSLAVAGGFTLASAHAATFADIQFWTGSGTNQAALVVDWNDGKSADSLLWGYQWNGPASGLDMFQAVVNADPRLFAHLGNFAWGTAIFGIGYDLNNSGTFGVSPSLSFASGGLSVGSYDDARLPADAADHWREGWDFGFWGYNLKASSSAAWSSAFFGPSDRVLSDGDWDGYSFAPGFSFTDPTEPQAAPAPEPSSLALILTGGLLLCVRRKQS